MNASNKVKTTCALWLPTEAGRPMFFTSVRLKNRSFFTVRRTSVMMNAANHTMPKRYAQTTMVEKYVGSLVVRFVRERINTMR